MKAPPGASCLSSRTEGPSVNEERPLVTLRQFLRLERRIRSLPEPRPPERSAVPKPADADQVLELLAVAYRPGDRVGRREFAAAAGVSVPTAGAVRRWAIDAGVWPYRDALSGFAARAVRRGRRKGGGE